MLWAVLSLLYDTASSAPASPTACARRMLAHFGSPSLPAVFAASTEELGAVAAIGPVRAGMLAWRFDDLEG